MLKTYLVIHEHRFGVDYSKFATEREDLQALEGCYTTLDFTDEVHSSTENLLPNIYSLSSLGYYIFSANFYLGARTGISKLEELLLDFIEDKELANY